MKRTGGYTLIEVMVAVVIMVIGATGILAMQGASVRSNQDAGETTTAVNFATTWIERIKRDASRRWTLSGTARMHASPYLTVTDGYFVPEPPDTRESWGANYFGFETRIATNTYYCVNVRGTVAHAYNPVTPNAPDLTTDVNALRVDVRVWWYRWGLAADRTAGPACTLAAGVLSPAQIADWNIRKHYLSTVVSWRAP